MALTSGERRHRIRFERPVQETNDFGEAIGMGWDLVIEVWAKRTNQLSATAEAVASGADTYREQVRFDILPREVSPDWRIVHRGKVYDIKSAGTSNDGSETAVIAVAGLNLG